MSGWRVPLREATPDGQAPKYLICDHDSKYGSGFRRVATTSGIKLLKTPVHAPQANAVCERFLRSVQQACLDHLLIFQEKQLQRVLIPICVPVDIFEWQEMHANADQSYLLERTLVSYALHGDTFALLLAQHLQKTCGEPAERRRRSIR